MEQASSSTQCVLASQSPAAPQFVSKRSKMALGALSPARRGPKASGPNPLAAELAKAQRENARLQQRLERAEAIIDLQKTFGPAGNPAGSDRQRRQILMDAVIALPPASGAPAAACAALGLSRASVHHRRTRLNVASDSQFRLT